MALTTTEVAMEIARLCKANDLHGAMAHYADNIVSIEAAGPTPRTEGLEAVKAKSAWWEENMQTNSFLTEGPWVCGDQFILHFDVDAVEKATGKPMVMKEAALYTVKDGKIVEESFFYPGG